MKLSLESAPVLLIVTLLLMFQPQYGLRLLLPLQRTVAHLIVLPAAFFCQLFAPCCLCGVFNARQVLLEGAPGAVHASNLTNTTVCIGPVSRCVYAYVC